MLNLFSKKWYQKHRKSLKMESKMEQQIIQTNPKSIKRELWYKDDFGGAAVSRRTCQRTLTNQQDSLLFTYINTKIEGKNIVLRWHTKKGTSFRHANTPWAPLGPKRIEDAMRRDTAAPSIYGFGVSWFVSVSGACSSVIDDPLVDLVWSWQIYNGFAIGFSPNGQLPAPIKARLS